MQLKITDKTYSKTRQSLSLGIEFQHGSFLLGILYMAVAPSILYSSCFTWNCRQVSCFFDALPITSFLIFSSTFYPPNQTTNNNNKIVLFLFPYYLYYNESKFIHLSVRPSLKIIDPIFIVMS